MSLTTNQLVGFYVFRTLIAFGTNQVYWQIHIQIVLLPNHASYPHRINDYAVPPQRPNTTLLRGFYSCTLISAAWAIRQQHIDNLLKLKGPYSFNRASLRLDSLRVQHCA
jgi:hypothetical protein